ncbi:MAG: CTP synthase (glutamine hydrolyzing) [Nanoarchaeota archaeon]|nr:CTP synthase (glutamine hydrolyzing) [Nanoarchaeota archaeon]MBU4452003.1 CTP synthase (glutamine hydrolyzing) [Nanoarchaeota archaeon]MCG2724091.1 CTP synthase (glutamine hydrolyzing) [archaeon]
MRTSSSEWSSKKSNCKWIIITGGVLSGLGKGIVSASIGRLLNTAAKVVPIKCDGYLNVDPGTINPYEHGEVFVLEDGGEVDMDFGHYERFMNINAKFSWNLTSGKIFKSVIDRERKGDFLGKTVQMIPQVTDEIKQTFKKIALEENADVVIIEIGGTVGDIENMLFLEAVRQMRVDVGRENIMYVHLSLVPEANGEQKTKPTQQSIKILQGIGIQPDIIVGRSAQKLTDKSKERIALFCNVEKKEVISDPDSSTIYEIPVIFEEEGLLNLINDKFDIGAKQDMKNWRAIVEKIKASKKEATIAVCGKYTDLHDAYASIIEALKHAGARLGVLPKIAWIETTEIEKGKKSVSDALSGVDGIIVPGGWGARGTEGKMQVIKFARENNIPFLGLCYGLQLALIEFARNVCGLDRANSMEIDKDTKHPVVKILPGQNLNKMGGTSRLGAYEADILKGSRVEKIYGSLKVSERHRHRYEVNPEYHDCFKKNGMVLSGTSENGKLVEFIELPNHKFFVATQAHPEFKSRLEKPAPMFLEFLRASST